MKYKTRSILVLIAVLGWQCALEPVTIGESCTFEKECTVNASTEDATCIQESINGESSGWPGGYCSADCSDNSSLCSDNSTCVLLGADSLCLSDCAADSDCRVNYVCETVLFVCLPDCRDGFDCGDRFTCNQTNGLCQ